MKELNEIIHQPARLKIMASLVALNPSEQVDFSYLKKLLDFTDGNLGAHLTKLNQAGYIKIEKAFIESKPRTFINATGKGRDAFSAHVKYLQEIIKKTKK